jgi:hypothetical protein
MRHRPLRLGEQVERGGTAPPNLTGAKAQQDVVIAVAQAAHRVAVLRR